MDIFSRKGLSVLEEGRDFTSRVLVYRNSLLAKKKADYFISFYEKTRIPQLYVCDPVPLYKIRHAELLGEENARLSTLIDQDIYGQQIKDVRELDKLLQSHDLPEENLVRPKRVVGLFLSLSKREEFVLQVQYLPSASKPMFEQKVSKERARDILYRLSYYNLLQPHYTFFTEYKEEHVSQPSTYRYRTLTGGPGIITYRDVYDRY